MYNNADQESQLFVAKILIVILVVGLAVFSGSYRKKRGISSPRSSVLLSFYTEGLSLVPIAQGEVGNMPFSAIMTVDAKVLIYRVELPFSSKMHLLGIPNRSDVIQLDPDSRKSLMEKVSLEGNYDNEFSLYAEKNEQTAARYALDPKAMLFTVEFCKSHNWEIIENELYFLQASANSEEDPTNMYADIERFVKEIRPALVKPLTPKEVKNALPYGVDARAQLPCPLCKKPMTNNRSYFACPDGHGVLLNGKRLLELKEGRAVVVPNLISEEKTLRNSIQCPSCGNTMSLVKYNGGKNVIDSCSRCPYRWLDHNEIIKITESKPLEGDYSQLL